MRALPKYFVIKNEGDSPLWKKYIDWLNKTYGTCTYWTGISLNYFYGYDGSECNRRKGTCSGLTLAYFQNSPTVITLEEWDSMVNSKTLQVGDKITICGIEGKVESVSTNNYYILCPPLNSIWFEKLNLDKRKTSDEILKYCLPGQFPQCKTLEDLTKLVNYLKEVEMKQQETPSIDLSKGWIVECGTGEKVGTVKNYLSLKYKNTKSISGYSSYKYVIDNGEYGNNNCDIISDSYTHLPILTFEQFESLILNKNKNEDGNKNINKEIGSHEIDTKSERGTAIRVPSRKGQIAIGSRPTGNKVSAKIQRATISRVKISSNVIAC